MSETMDREQWKTWADVDGAARESVFLSLRRLKLHFERLPVDEFRGLEALHEQAFAVIHAADLALDALGDVGGDDDE